MTPSPLEVPTAIHQRRSIKSFKSDPIPDALLRQLIELTVAAPSGWNLQDWRIVVVRGESQKQALAEAAFGQQQVLEAPVTFVFAADRTAWQTDLDAICQKGLETGAWNQQTVDYFKDAIPKSQAALGEQQREYAIKNAIIAATHTALAAESLGLSSCFMNGWTEDKVKAVIGASDRPEIVIALLLPVGYKAEPRQNPGRLPLSRNVFIDSLEQPFEG